MRPRLPFLPQSSSILQGIFDTSSPQAKLCLLDADLDVLLPESDALFRVAWIGRVGPTLPTLVTTLSSAA